MVIIDTTGVDAIIESAMQSRHLAGVALGIVRDGQLVHARGYGHADIDSGRPVTTETVFRIASISKTFTAVALMQLWEQNRFGLDEPVNQYLRAYKVEHRDPRTPPVTFRHLLTHTSGIGELRTVSDVFRFRKVIGLAADEGEQPSLSEYYGGRLEPSTAPDRKWAYANHGFATLGQLVEDISGIPFEQYMIERLFEPLGMRGTDYLRSERVRDRLATGYAANKDSYKPVKYQEIAPRPAGSMFSSIDDMALYVVGLLNEGTGERGAILKPATLRTMLTPHYQVDERIPAMGLAFFLDRLDGHPVAYHNGNWNGFASSMYIAPDDNLGVLLFTNTSTLTTDGLTRQVVRHLLGVPDPRTRLPRLDVPPAPEAWPELTGAYGPRPGFRSNMTIWGALGGEAEVVERDAGLVLRSLAGVLRKGVPLYPVDAADSMSFETVWDDQVFPVVFQRGADGAVDCLFMGALSVPITLWKRRRTESLRFRLLAGAAGTGVLALVGLGALGLRRLARRN
jgi:CubicO group peptidase (beta-lactamase class C family)